MNPKVYNFFAGVGKDFEEAGWGEPGWGYEGHVSAKNEAACTLPRAKRKYE